VQETSRFARRSGWASIVCLLVGGFGYGGLYRFDHQMANLALMVFLLLSILLGFVAFLVNRKVPWTMRIVSLLIPVVGIVIFLKQYEFRGFSGELVPQFRLRQLSRKKPDEPTNASVERATKLKIDDPSRSFRQFLGNERTGKVSGIELSEAWDTNLPRIVWKKPIGLGWAGFAIQAGLAITLEEYEGRDCIVALNLEDGSVLWRTPLERKHYHAMDGGGPSATPTLDGEQSFFAQSSTGIVCCGELATGNLLWKVDLLEKAGITQKEAEVAVTWGRSGSPLLYQDLVIVPFGGTAGKSPGGLIALDRMTGEERWRGGKSQISYASPSVMTILDSEQIVIVNESTVTGHDPQSGVELWSHVWPGQSNGGATVSQAVSIDDQRILISKAYGGGAEMLDFSESSPPKFVVKRKWKNTSLLKTKFTTAIYCDGYLYGLSDGILECVDAESGKRTWKDTREGRLGHGQVLLVGKHLVISCEDGRVVVGQARPDAFHKIGELPVLTGITWNTLAIAGNRLLMRNGEEAACIEMPIHSDSQSP
jgi:outer membrane protein assembly factor BamB